MSKKVDCAGSYPVSPVYDPHNACEPWPGITLRQYYAAKAMQAIVSRCMFDIEGDPEIIHRAGWAKHAFLISDAMVEEGQRGYADQIATLARERDEARRRSGLFETQYEQLRSRVRTLEEAIVTEVGDLYDDGTIHRGCLLCGASWPEDSTPSHREYCPLAPAPAKEATGKGCDNCFLRHDCDSFGPGGDACDSWAQGTSPCEPSQPQAGEEEK